MHIDIFHESKSEFRQNVSAINKRQIKDVRVEHLASDSIAMSGWTFSQIQIKIFFKLIYLSKFTKCFKNKVYFGL